MSKYRTSIYELSVSNFIAISNSDIRSIDMHRNSIRRNIELRSIEMSDLDVSKCQISIYRNIGLRYIVLNAIITPSLPPHRYAEGSLEDDREALISLYLALGGPDWTNNANWTDNNRTENFDLGTWHGVCLLYTSPSPRD